MPFIEKYGGQIAEALLDYPGEMKMNDVVWLDGKPATGKFVMQMVYANGGTAYMKSDTYEGIVNHYNLLISCPDVVDAHIYNPAGEQVNEHRMAA